MDTPDPGTFYDELKQADAEIERLRAALAEAGRERDALAADLARVSEEFDLPPTIGPAPGEIRRLRAERLAAEASLAQARAECDRLNAAVLALQEGRAGAERALAQAREVLQDCAIFMESAERHVSPRGTPWHAGLLAMIDKARALASALGRGDGGGTT